MLWAERTLHMAFLAGMVQFPRIRFGIAPKVMLGGSRGCPWVMLLSWWLPSSPHIGHGIVFSPSCAAEIQQQCYLQVSARAHHTSIRVAHSMVKMQLPALIRIPAHLYSAANHHTGTPGHKNTFSKCYLTAASRILPSQGTAQ